MSRRIIGVTVGTTISPDKAIAKAAKANDNRLLSESTFGYGDGNVIGSRGYYFSAIDFENKTITLSEKQDSAVTPTNPIGWTVGDVVSIDNGMKYELCSTITTINGNVITVDQIPFETIHENSEPDVDEWTICVPAKPDKGVVDLGKGAAAFGEDNQASGWGAFIAGIKNIITAYYGLVGGVGNRVDAYAGIAAGSKNKIHPGAHYSATYGRENEVFGGTSIAEGNVTKAIADCTHAGGSHTKATRKYQTVFGVNNKEDNDALFIIGNGMTVDENGKEQPDYNKPSNAFVVKKNGTILGGGKELVDKAYLGSTIWSKVDDIRSVKSGVALSTILRSGFYKLSDSHPDLPSSDSIWSQMIVSSDSASHVQIVLPKSGKAIYYRASEGGKYPDKWTTLFVNNDIYPGTEYLTTEVFQGKPVYVKLVGISLATSGVKSASIAYKIAHVLSVDGIVHDTLNAEHHLLSKSPYVSECHVTMSASSGNLIINSEAMSGWMAWITVKYTKQ